MITPNTASAPASHETAVPLSALAIAGINPDAGDTVQFNAEGTVTRIDGDRAIVRLEKVNEQMLTEAADIPDEAEQMRKLAQAADENPLY